MKRVFISQPMNGLTDLEISLERNRITDWLYSTGLNRSEIFIIDSFIDEDAPGDINVPLWYLGKSIELLATADIVVFAKGWERARGCLIEHKCAAMYGIPIICEEKEVE